MRKLLSAMLLALGVGAWAADRPAEAASYGGAASSRCCPPSVACGGHVQYQAQRTVVLRPVQETGYEAQQGQNVRDVVETVMQPRTVTTMQTITEQACKAVPYTVQTPVYRTVCREQRYTVQKPVSRTVWKNVTHTVMKPVRPNVDIKANASGTPAKLEATPAKVIVTGRSQRGRLPMTSA